MRKLWLAGFVLLTGIVLLAGWLLWLAYDGPGVNERNYERIQVGMTRAEVENLLGGPPDEGREPMEDILIASVFLQFKNNRLESETELWYGDRFVIMVVFDEQGCVRGKDKDGVEEGPIWERIRRWLHL